MNPVRIPVNGIQAHNLVTGKDSFVKSDSKDAILFVNTVSKLPQYKYIVFKPSQAEKQITQIYSNLPKVQDFQRNV